jgi:hypothetical protein
MKNIINHDNFEDALTRVIKGETIFVIPTAYKMITIDDKVIDKFQKVDRSVIKKSVDNKGFRLASGKKTVYIFGGQLIEVTK